MNNSNQNFFYFYDYNSLEPLYYIVIPDNISSLNRLKPILQENNLSNAIIIADKSLPDRFIKSIMYQDMRTQNYQELAYMAEIDRNNLLIDNSIFVGDIRRNMVENFFV